MDTIQFACVLTICIVLYCTETIIQTDAIRRLKKLHRDSPRKERDEGGGLSSRVSTAPEVEQIDIELYLRLNYIYLNNSNNYIYKIPD